MERSCKTDGVGEALLVSCITPGVQTKENQHGIRIDEVHILKETRGATLEAVVSRMKSVGSDVRFVALSATVPNSEDIASWLGREPSKQQLPAHRECFGEGFRPVKLKKFVYGIAYKGSDFGFETACDPKYVVVW